MKKLLFIFALPCFLILQSCGCCLGEEKDKEQDEMEEMLCVATTNFTNGATYDATSKELTVCGTFQLSDGCPCEDIKLEILKGSESISSNWDRIDEKNYESHACGGVERFMKIQFHGIEKGDKFSFQVLRNGSVLFSKSGEV